MHNQFMKMVLHTARSDEANGVRIASISVWRDVRKQDWSLRFTCQTIIYRSTARKPAPSMRLPDVFRQDLRNSLDSRLPIEQIPLTWDGKS